VWRMRTSLPSCARIRGCPSRTRIDVPQEFSLAFLFHHNSTSSRTIRRVIRDGFPISTTLTS